MVRVAALPAGPLFGVALAVLLAAGGMDLRQAMLAGITAWCAVWWVTEPVPVPATSLLPLALLPALGILDHKSTAHAYGDTLILLLWAGSC